MASLYFIYIKILMFYRIIYIIIMFKMGFILDNTYCYKTCKIGKAACESCLYSAESVFDAVFNFQLFTENCFKTCLHMLAHVNNKDKESC